MGQSAADFTSRLLRQERAILAGSIVLLTGLSWWFLAGGMAMSGMQPPLTALIVMWWVMMVAMMLPSATPAVLLYARVRQTHGGGAAIVEPWVFLTGYLTVWLLFSIAAAVTQSQLIGSSMALRGSAGQSALLVTAGVYQLSPLKSVCVSHCRSPGQFISRHWRGGAAGAIRLGVMHGAYCVGCCWMLMALLFVGGAMNLWWVVGLTALVACEKLLPNALAVQKVSGVVLIAWGVLKVVG